MVMLCAHPRLPSSEKPKRCFSFVGSVEDVQNTAVDAMSSWLMVEQIDKEG
jgi:hypothetical protein